MSASLFIFTFVGFTSVNSKLFDLKGSNRFVNSIYELDLDELGLNGPDEIAKVAHLGMYLSEAGKNDGKALEKWTKVKSEKFKFISKCLHVN